MTRTTNRTNRKERSTDMYFDTEDFWELPINLAKTALFFGELFFPLESLLGAFMLIPAFLVSALFFICFFICSPIYFVFYLLSRVKFGDKPKVRGSGGTAPV